MRRATGVGAGRCGYYSLAEIEEVEAQGIETYVPDPLLARELAGGDAVMQMSAAQMRRCPGLRQLRERMRGNPPRAAITHAEKRSSSRCLES